MQEEEEEEEEEEEQEEEEGIKGAWKKEAARYEDQADETRCDQISSQLSALDAMPEMQSGDQVPPCLAVSSLAATLSPRCPRAENIPFPPPLPYSKIHNHSSPLEEPAVIRQHGL